MTALSRLACGLLPLMAVACSKSSGGLVNTPGAPALDPAALSFGQVPVGDRRSLQLQVADVGDGPLVITATAFTGANAGDFTIVAGAALPATVQAQAAAAQFTIAFQPTAAAAESAMLVLSLGDAVDPASVHTASVPLDGRGVSSSQLSLEVAPSGCLDFNTVGLQNTARRQLTLTNGNPFPILPRLTGFSGPQASEFGAQLLSAGDGGFDAGTGDGGLLANGPLAVLAPGGAAVLAVSFEPQVVGPASASLGVSACSACAVQPICLSGSGLDSQLVLDSPSLDFGLVLNAPLPLPQRQVTARVVGDTPIYVAGVAAGSPNSVFSVSGAPQGQLFQPDASFNFAVAYDPSGLPAGDSDTVVVSGVILQGTPNQAPRLARLPVRGDAQLPAGCALVAVPQGGVDFGTLAPGQQATRLLSLENHAAGTCAISPPQLTAESNSDFSLGQDPLPLTDGGSVIIVGHGYLKLPVTFAAPAVPSVYRPQGAVTFVNASVAQAVPLRAKIQSLTGSSPWPKWQHDAANTGRSDSRTGQVSGKVKWSYRLPASYNLSQGTQTYAPVAGGYSFGPILGAEGNLYQMAFDGTFVALDSQSGQLAWSYYLYPPSPRPLPLATLSGDNSIFLSLGNNHNYGTSDFFQFSPSAQRPVFSAQLFSISAPAVGPGGQVYALQNSASCGQPDTIQYYVQDVLQPSVTVPLKRCSYGTVTPAVDNAGNVFWCTGGTCFKTNPQAVLLWNQTIGVANDQLGGAPVLSGSNLYYLSFGVQTDYPAGRPPSQNYHAALYQLDATSSDPSPQLLYAAPVVAFADPLVDSNAFLPFYSVLPYTPAIAGDGAIVFPYVDGLYCVESQGAHAGQLRWRLSVPGGVLGNPSLSADGLVYAGTYAQGLLAVDLQSGVQRWSFALPDAQLADGGYPVNSVSSQPVLADEVVYFTGDDGVIYALE